MEERRDPISDQLILLIPQNRIEEIVGNTDSENWSLKPEFHQKYIQCLEGCFGQGKVQYASHTFIADGTMFVQLMSVDGRHAAVVTNEGDEFGDDENYAALGFYEAIGEQYGIDAAPAPEEDAS